MNKFTEGRMIRAIRETRSLFETFPVGTIFKVGKQNSEDMLREGEVTAGPSDFPQRYILQKQDFEVMIDWQAVRPGDTVTFKDFVLHRENTSTAVEHDGDTYILGIDTASPWIATHWYVVSIEKPGPVLPTTPGSVVFKLTPQAERANNGRGFSVFRLASNTWITSEGYKWSDKDLREQYGAGFEIIYDAGAKNE